jgi:crossover junction endodeoxyribonuclease RuvC
MTVYIGIDPGKTGALAIIRDNGEKALVYDVDTGSGPELVRVLEEAQEKSVEDLLLGIADHTRAAVEKVGSMPKQGVASSFSFGYSAGVIEGVLCASLIPFEFVRPQEWKKAFNLLGKEKGEARDVARRLFPSLLADLRRVKDCGRADALLMAEWLRRREAR